MRKFLNNANPFGVFGGLLIIFAVLFFGYISFSESIQTEAAEKQRLLRGWLMD